MSAATPTDVASVDPATLADWLLDGGELALLDAREQGVFLGGHLFHAACVPLSHLELTLPKSVPRRSVRIVWCDAGTIDDDLAVRVARRATELGWSANHVLAGGVAAWAETGREVYRGVNVPSKAFGEYVEQAAETPRMTAPEVKQLLDTDADVVVLDARPVDEFRRMSIPTGIDCPGAELVYRIKQVVTDPATLVVVNCAGRTRSIIGCQSLRNAGIENRVVALENGTMGWELAGFEVAHGSQEHAPDPDDRALAWARDAATAVGRRFAVEHIDHPTLSRWLTGADRTTFVLDVRTPDEYAAGHLPGSTSAPGGQLVQATDEYVAIRNARLVLVDGDGVRATMTASWLRQMGWLDAVVLDEAFVGQELEQGPGDETTLSDAPTPSPTIDCNDLVGRIADPSLVVLDLGSSLTYRNRGHIPGAWWGVRSRLAAARTAIGPATTGTDTPVTLVLTSSDGVLAGFAVSDAQRFWPDATVVALDGGTRAWRDAGHETEEGFVRPTTDPDDVWYKPYDHDGDVMAQHMQDYLDWEIALVDQLERDPTVTFHGFG